MAWLREIALEFVGHHREIGQRSSYNKLDRVMEHTDSDESQASLTLETWFVCLSADSTWSRGVWRRVSDLGIERGLSRQLLQFLNL